MQHAYATRKGSWTAESKNQQILLSFENLYTWIELQHSRRENKFIKDDATGFVHRYTLPLKTMRVPPQKLDVFKWRKGQLRLSNWMLAGGLVGLIPDLQPPTLVAPPPMEAARNARRDQLWRRVAQRASNRPSISAMGDNQDSCLTRDLVSAVMDSSREKLNEKELNAVETEILVELEKLSEMDDSETANVVDDVDAGATLVLTAGEQHLQEIEKMLMAPVDSRAT